MFNNQSIIIGVCGNSCSGKSDVCNKLTQLYPDKILHIKADKFFKKESNKITGNIKVYNTPDDINFEMLIKTIRELKTDKYSFMPSKAFTEKFDKKIESKKIILLDGFLIYTNKELLNLIDKKIFLEIDDNELIKRRLKRENESIEIVKTEVINPAKIYENIQKKEANYIIDSNKNKDIVLNELLKILKPLI